MKHKPLTTYLRRHRLRSGLSHDDVAYLLGSIYGSNIGKHERAQRLPLLRNALAYELIFGTPVRDLYEGVYCDVRVEVRGRMKTLCASLERKPRSAHRQRKLEALRRLLAQNDQPNSSQGHGT